MVTCVHARVSFKRVRCETVASPSPLDPRKPLASTWRRIRGAAALPLQSITAPPYSRQGADDGSRRVGEPRQHQAHDQGRVVQVPVSEGGGEESGQGEDVIGKKVEAVCKKEDSGAASAERSTRKAGGDGESMPAFGDLMGRQTTSRALVASSGRVYRAHGAADTSVPRAVQLQKIRP